MSTQSVADLLGENLSGDPLGEDMAGGLVAGFIPNRSIVYQPQTIIGDGLAGPVNDQQLAIYRDNRVLAVDELGKQGPFLMPEHALARHRAGRMFPLNEEYGPASLDHSLPGRRPEMDARSPSPFSPGQLPPWHDGVPAIELVANPRTVYYTASPNVGWEGY